MDKQTEVQNVIKEIERKTENIVVNGFQNGTLTADKLSATMHAGFDEFEKKVGRPMSYSEMRAAFG